MTKADLVANMAKDAGISKPAAGKALSSFTGNVTKALKKKDGKVRSLVSGHFQRSAVRPERAEILQRVSPSRSRHLPLSASKPVRS